MITFLPIFFQYSHSCYVVTSEISSNFQWTTLAIQRNANFSGTGAVMVEQFLHTMLLFSHTILHMAPRGFISSAAVPF